MSRKTCYMCAKPAVSVEHVPPKCFFPEKKDLPEGVDYRVGLITVPACKEHNIGKSKDDEYLLSLIAAQMGNSPVANDHYSSKILRALKHSAGLKAKLTEGARNIKVEGEKLLALKIDRDRFHSGLAKMVRGIYYHSYGQQLLTPVQIHCPQMWDENIAPDKNVKRICDQWGKALADQPVQGENPGVFTYQLLQPEGFPLVIARMVFYSGVEIVALSGASVIGVPCK